MQFIKLVDGSADLGITSKDVIDTKEKLYALLRTHFERLVKDKSEDEQLFWATYSFYRVNADDDEIFLIGNLIPFPYPIYDVSVEKSDQTSIQVIPYKLSHVNELTLTNLWTYTPESGDISTLELMGWEEMNPEQKWKGKVWLRGGFSGWNCVNARIEFEL